MTVAHVPGTRSRHIMLYALSTCGYLCAREQPPEVSAPCVKQRRSALSGSLRGEVRGEGSPRPPTA